MPGVTTKQELPKELQSPYGDDRIAEDFSLTVVIEARGMLAELHREDDACGRPRRRWTPLELEETYDRAQDRVAARRRQEDERVHPVGDIAEEIRQMGEAVIARLKATACGGLVENVDACTEQVYRECPEADKMGCARVLAADRGVKPSVARRAQDLGVPDEIASFLGGKPDRHGRNFDDQHVAVRHVRRWLEDPTQPPFLLLAGGTGVGKSVAAGWGLLQRGGRWASAFQVAGRCREDGYLSLVCACGGVLVLDDLGAEALSEEGKAAVERISYERGARRTVITANVEREVLVERYTRRFVDRVAPSLGEGVPNWSKKIPGKSMR